MSLFSFQGKVWLAERDVNGQPLNPIWVGNAPNLQLQLGSESTTKNDSYTGNRLQIGQLNTAKSATINLTLDEWTEGNLALAFYGEKTAVATGTVTAEALPTGLGVGDIVRLDHPFVSSLTIDDSGGELVLGTDYEIESANGGLIKFLLAPTAPVTADYSHAASDSLKIFATQPPERWLFLDGINTASNNAPVLVDLFKVQFSPVSDLSLITDEYGSIALTGTVLFDTQNNGAALGGFGRIQMPGA